MFFPNDRIHADISSLKRRVTLVTTFVGLDEVFWLPPNIHMVGPLFKDQNDLMKNFAEKDQKLLDWMNDDACKSVVYLSLGSLCAWTQWEVDALYHGLKKLGVRVVWSIKKKEMIPNLEDPDFWISHWTPQVEVLNHPKTVAGLTHAGFGGVLEFCSAGVPVALLPHFGD